MKNNQPIPLLHIHHPAPDGLAAIYELKNGVGTMYYAQTDYQGSLMMLVKADGTRKNDLSFDAWGNRRDPNTWTLKTATDFVAELNTPTLITDRGYTMHEHMDTYGLINMNGRAYDQRLGQFLSPDPEACGAESDMQAPENPQNYNRYAYCLNNPMKYTDPTGYNHGQPRVIIDDEIEWHGTADSYIRTHGANIDIIEYNGQELFNSNKFHWEEIQEKVGFTLGEETISYLKKVQNQTIEDFNNFDFSYLDGGPGGEPKRRTSRPDDDGYLTYGEADGWWKWGKGERLIVNLRKLDLSTVSSSKFKKPDFTYQGHPGIYVNFESKQYYVNRDQALVYGSIALVLVGDKTVIALDDKYDFDLRLTEGSFMRDLLTMCGAFIAGYGKPFPISFYNNAILSK